jgi:dipeptidase E
VVLCGVSAGGMCWFEGGATDSLTPDLSVLADGLGLLRGAFAPHCDETPRRWTVLREAVERGFAPGYGVEDGAALHFVGTELVECVTTRAQARVRRIDAAGREAALPTRVLG